MTIVTQKKVKWAITAKKYNNKDNSNSLIVNDSK